MEIQIRTHDMHQVAEYGVAAHWLYKETGELDIQFEEKMTWLRQLLEWQRDVSGAVEFVESFKTDIFQNQVFVYTPGGDVIELPMGSTPLDYEAQTDGGIFMSNGVPKGLFHLDMNSHSLALTPAKIIPQPDYNSSMESPQWSLDLLTAAF